MSHQRVYGAGPRKGRPVRAAGGLDVGPVVAGDVVVRYYRLFELEWYEAGASGPQPTD